MNAVFQEEIMKRKFNVKVNVTLLIAMLVSVGFTFLVMSPNLDAKAQIQTSQVQVQQQQLQMQQLQILLPDLIVRIVECPKVAYVGEKVKIVIKTSNIGKAPAGPPITWDWGLSWDSNIPIKFDPYTADPHKDRALLHGTETGYFTLKAGESTSNHSIPHGIIPNDTIPGKYYLGVVVDPNKKITESNEKNNTAYCQIYVKAKPSKKPDVDITDIWLDDKCRIWIKHTNNGATGLDVILRERVWVDGHMVDDSRETIRLAPGMWTSHGVGADPGIIVHGGSVVKATVDVDNVLIESNEVNNTKEKRLFCKTRKRNDIDVTDIWLDDKCRLWVKHTNRGTSDLDIVLRERIWVNGRLVDDSRETIKLAPGKFISHGVGANPGVIIQGAADIKAQIDVDNILVETNEFNNILKKRVYCRSKRK
jgi:subtilase family serine protease